MAVAINRHDRKFSTKLMPINGYSHHCYTRKAHIYNGLTVFFQFFRPYLGLVLCFTQELCHKIFDLVDFDKTRTVFIELNPDLSSLEV